MNRVQLVAALKGHTPLDDKERVDLEAMQRWAHELTDPFSRTQQPAHFTASALVIDEAGQNVCLVHHAKLNRWLQPGGHVEPTDEDLAAAALREAREETGLQVTLHPTAPRPFDVDVHTIPQRKAEPEHSHLDVRFVVLGHGVLAHDPNESHAVKWVPLAEAIATADEASLRRMFEKLRAV